MPNPAISYSISESLLDKLDREIASARKKFPPFNSEHEGYAVLLEEVEELWDEIKKNQSLRDYGRMEREAIQVAAMALRFVNDCTNGKPRNPLAQSPKALEGSGE